MKEFHLDEAKPRPPRRCGSDSPIVAPAPPEQKRFAALIRAVDYDNRLTETFFVSFGVSILIRAAPLPHPWVGLRSKFGLIGKARWGKDISDKRAQGDFMGASRAPWAIDMGVCCGHGLAPLDNTYRFATAFAGMLYDDVESTGKHDTETAAVWCDIPR